MAGTMADFIDTRVASYLASLTPESPDVIARVRARSMADGVPAVAPDTARVLQVLAAMLPATRVFEIGTGYGLSGLAVALAAGPGHLLLTVERDAARAAVAREHFEQAGLGTRANVMVGNATRLVHKVAGPFDLIVQDGDKESYAPLLDRLVSLLRPGGVLVSDNILWSGDVVPGFSDVRIHSQASTDAIGGYNARLAADPRLRTTFLPVGDGLAISVRVEGTP
jgi:predicted O-methyltransferase YrrM